MWFLLLISLFLTTPETEPVETFTLFDFSNPDHAEFWSITNDGVMGGVSQGQWDAEEDRGIFSGFVSLDNNGGFSSVRASSVHSIYQLRMVYNLKSVAMGRNIPSIFAMFIVGSVIGLPLRQK